MAAEARVVRLVDEAIARFELDLSGTTVLTETASGPFVVTPLIAARAGASVIAVTRDSTYGAAAEIEAYTGEWAARLDVAVDVHAGDARERAGDADLVTNLGFVRPIDAAFVERMRPGAAVSLMCEPWEVRPSDADVAACRAAGVPVLGTDERDPRVQTFRFVGMLAVKLLLELEIEVLLSRIVVVSSEPFATPIVDTLRAAGAEVRLCDVTKGDTLQDVAGVDALVMAEHRERRAIDLPLQSLRDAGVAVAHIAGAIDDPQELLRKSPAGAVEPGWMTVTTDVLGPRPVVDLHAAGLRVGQALVAEMRAHGDAARAEAAALITTPALQP
jgi:hypothetical protein